MDQTVEFLAGISGTGLLLLHGMAVLTPITVTAYRCPYGWLKDLNKLQPCLFGYMSQSNSPVLCGFIVLSYLQKRRSIATVAFYL